MWRRLAILLAAAVIGGALAGCAADKFTRVNYECVYEGLSAEGVVERLGEPTGRTDAAWTYVREAPYRKAVIHFGDGAVVRKEWSYERDRPAGHGMTNDETRMTNQ